MSVVQVGVGCSSCSQRTNDALIIPLCGDLGSACRPAAARKGLEGQISKSGNEPLSAAASTPTLWGVWKPGGDHSARARSPRGRLAEPRPCLRNFGTPGFTPPCPLLPRTPKKQFLLQLHLIQNRLIRSLRSRAARATSKCETLAGPRPEAGRRLENRRGEETAQQAQLPVQSGEAKVPTLHHPSSRSMSGARSPVLILN